MENLTHEITWREVGDDSGTVYVQKGAFDNDHSAQTYAGIFPTTIGESWEIVSVNRLEG